jgi:sarcosine oxidase subunit gamma
VADLLPTPALAEAPLALAGVTLALADPGPLSLIAPFPGAAAGVAAALAPLGLTFPAAGRSQTAGAARILWTGRDQAFLAGIAAPATLSPHAAVTDQTDGWATLSLTGTGAAEVLARLVPLDLRPAAFAPGSVARSALMHCPLIVLAGDEGFALMTFRSMARTAWHEIATALRQRAARIGAPQA